MFEQEPESPEEAEEFQRMLEEQKSPPFWNSPLMYLLLVLALFWGGLIGFNYIKHIRAGGRLVWRTGIPPVEKRAGGSGIETSLARRTQQSPHRLSQVERYPHAPS